MILVEKWINASREERTMHLDLNSKCIERGGNSTVHRGVLAEYLNTNFASKVDLCHACGNGECSNPKHLYWGTRYENIQDAKNHGTWKSPWQRSVELYGYENACRMNARGDKSKGGRAGKGKKLSDEHKSKISNTLKQRNASVVKLANTSGLSPDASA